MSLRAAPRCQHLVVFALPVSFLLDVRLSAKLLCILFYPVAAHPIIKIHPRSRHLSYGENQLLPPPPSGLNLSQKSSKQTTV
jgi:hypothetical protein